MLLILLFVTQLANVYGAWSTWTSWDTCSATCNGGLQSRTRACINPDPLQFGRDCRGTDLMQQICNTQNCPVERKVGFSVHSSISTELTRDKTPTFAQTVMNTGSYDIVTGKFTCPVAGIYMFALTLQHNSEDKRNVQCFFRVNGVTKMLVEAVSDRYDQSSGSMVVILAVGDIVDLECENWFYVFHDSSTSFSGVLIRPTTDSLPWNQSAGPTAYYEVVN